jgi:S1-C subfamily serine protease
MSSFGVQKQSLRAIAKTPEIPTPLFKSVGNGNSTIAYTWMGVILSEPKGAELSAFGIGFGESGVALGNVEKASSAYELGLRTGDLIMSIDGKKVENIENMKKIMEQLNANHDSHTINIIRNQKGQNLVIKKKLEPINDRPQEQ